MNKQEVDINIKIDLANFSASISKESNFSNEKIKTSLSVAQIAYLIRLIFDAEIISSKNKSEALSKITSCVVTKNATQISLKSLKSKFYSPDPATKLSVKKLLQSMIDSIEVYE